MARRQLDTAFWDDPDVARLSVAARMLFVCMITDTSLTDDFGVLPDNTAILKKHAFGYDACTLEDVAGWRDEILACCRNVVRAEHEGQPYLILRNFAEYQGIRYQRKSTYPRFSAPLPQNCGNVPQDSENVPENSCSSRGEVRRGEVSCAAETTPTTPAFRQDAIRAYENAIGLVSGALQNQEIGDFLGELESKGLTDWWALAIQACADQNKRSWAYMRAVLKAWLAQGHPGNGNGQARAAPAKPDPKAEVRSWDPLRELWEVYVGDKLHHTEKGPAPAAQPGSGAGGVGQPTHRPGRDGPGRGDGANGRGVVRTIPRRGVSGHGRAGPTGQAG